MITLLIRAISGHAFADAENTRKNRASGENAVSTRREGGDGKKIRGYVLTLLLSTLLGSRVPHSFILFPISLDSPYTHILMGLLAEGVHEIGIVDGDVVLICSSYGLGDVLLYLLWCEYGLSALSPPPLQGDRCPIPLGVPSLNGPLSSSDTVARRK